MTTLRSRQQRRKTGRAPGVWRGAAQPPTAVERSPVQHGVRTGIGLSWRAFSGLIVISLMFVLSLFFATDFFYVRSVDVAGVRYLSKAEVFRYADIAEMHIFWVDPERVRENILAASPVIADARVTVSWPPNMVRIVVVEREPAVIWVQAGVVAWVDLQGRVLRFPPQDDNSRPDLIRVIADNSIEGPPGGNVLVDEAAVNGALQLQSLLPGLAVLRYNPTKGLGFREPGGWDVWMGTGTNMRDKLLVYVTISANLQARGIIPIEINVANPDAPYYCGSIELCNG